MNQIKFIKANGLGNDFVIFPKYNNLKITKSFINYISDRKVGVGCDLVVFIKESENNFSDLVVKFFNRDGSEAEICGNALRCVGKYFNQLTKKKNLTVETNSGLIDIAILNPDKIAVDLGKPNLSWDKIPLIKQFDTHNMQFNFDYLKDGFAVNIGNPHVIFFVDEIYKEKLEVDSVKILKKNYFPKGVNVSVVKISSKKIINILTFERGVGITEACGSGAGAAAFASFILNHCNRNIQVCMNGGNLNVEITQDKHILTIGDAKEVFNGEIKLEKIYLDGKK